MSTNDGYDLKYFLRPISENKRFFVSILSIVIICSICLSLISKKYWVSEVVISPISSTITHKMNMELPNFSYINKKWEYKEIFTPQLFIDEYIKTFTSQEVRAEFCTQSLLFSRKENEKELLEKINKELFYRFDKIDRKYVFYSKTNNPDYSFKLIKRYTDYVKSKMIENIELSEKKRNKEELDILNKKLSIQNMIAEDNKSKQLFDLEKSLIIKNKFNLKKDKLLISSNGIPLPYDQDTLSQLIEVNNTQSLQYFNKKIPLIEINIKLIDSYLNGFDLSKYELINVNKVPVVPSKTVGYSKILIVLGGVFLAIIIATILSIIKFSFRKEKEY